jgi:ABC-type antimicrobial peptide transport system permease subunit
MLLALVGIFVGLGAAFGLARFMASFLFGVHVWDPLAFVAVPVVLSAVALLAVWLPARHASRVDPIIALRAE